MTGTAMTDAQEFETIYGLKVVPVPTALPIARRDYPDVAFKTRTAADDAMVKEIKNVGGGQEGGRPCLVGTTSVEQSEVVIKKLAEAGIKAELLNASPKNAPRESEIVAQAGRTGAVTVATNMAGRGTDILLGGCPKTMARIKTRSSMIANGVLSKEEVEKLPPSPPEDYYPCPLDQQQQDDDEDEDEDDDEDDGDDLEAALQECATSIKEAFGSEVTAIQLDEILTVATDTTEADDDPDYIIKLRDVTEAIKERYAEVTEADKKIVQAAGGLYVMGTKRHESSRIDNQLRGRAGRQGDPGTSRFFLSFQDDMFVIFGGDKLQNILQTFRVSDDMPVEAPQVSEALDKVQAAVEEKYRGIRTEIFKFDQILNEQREVIYSRRRQILNASDEESVQMMKEYNHGLIADLVKAQTDGGKVNGEKIVEKVKQFFPLAGPVIQAEDIEGMDEKGAVNFLSIAVDEVFNQKAAALDEQAKAAGKSPNSIGRSARYIALVTMDNAWSDHLQILENLKEAVVVRGFQGLNPLQEYRKEAFDQFQGLEDTMRNNAVFSLWQGLVQ
jgi:preprotein translocase subunit SecA